MKRTFDLMLSLTALAVLAIPMLIVAMMVKLTSLGDWGLGERKGIRD